MQLQKEHFEALNAAIMKSTNSNDAITVQEVLAAAKIYGAPRNKYGAIARELMKVPLDTKLKKLSKGMGFVNYRMNPSAILSAETMAAFGAYEEEDGFQSVPGRGQEAVNKKQMDRAASWEWESTSSNVTAGMEERLKATARQRDRFKGMATTQTGPAQAAETFGGLETLAADILDVRTALSHGRAAVKSQAQSLGDHETAINAQAQMLKNITDSVDTIGDVVERIVKALKERGVEIGGASSTEQESGGAK